jgi:hypothetical protein
MSATEVHSASPDAAAGKVDMHQAGTDMPT